MEKIPVSKVRTKQQAIDIAVAWSLDQADKSMSHLAMIEWQIYFDELAEKFNLQDEFVENGLI